MNTTDFKALLDLLAVYQCRMMGLFEQECSSDSAVHYHVDMSPTGWHLGHCVYTEIFWLRQQLLGLATVDVDLQACYMPELSAKSQRGKRLPDYAELVEWAKAMQRENLRLLQGSQPAPNGPLMQYGFLLHFLIQHYAQHIETMYMVLTQRSLKKRLPFIAQQPLQSNTLNTASVLLKAGEYTIGAQTVRLPYDNEYPLHKFVTKDVRVACLAVSNAEFLLFMQEGGYEKKYYWSEQGWQWRRRNGACCPELWQQDEYGGWFEYDLQGAHDLEPQHAVKGICYFEAQAFCAWGAVRLPHEHEWEAMMQYTGKQQAPQVWEWCDNSFFPYVEDGQGFVAFPYENYSSPYFDGQHFVLRGASHYTQTAIRRYSFRNYYQADKRYQFAGLRVVFE